MTDKKVVENKVVKKKTILKKKSEVHQEILDDASVAKGAAVAENLSHAHPLLNMKMSLMEISNSTVEVLVRAQYKIVGESKGDYKEDVENFKDILFEKLVTFN